MRAVLNKVPSLEIRKFTGSIILHALYIESKEKLAAASALH